jgi:hypothetical protein
VVVKNVLEETELTTMVRRPEDRSERQLVLWNLFLLHSVVVSDTATRKVTVHETMVVVTVV